MGCNCGKNRTAAKPRTFTGSVVIAQAFSLVKRDGSAEKFGSRLEADAANARQGYTGIVKPVGS